MESLDAGELGAYFALVTAGDLVQRAVATQLSEHGLTPLQFTILARLLDAPSGLRMRDLADMLVVSRSGLTYQVTQLERQRLLTREASTEDDRGVTAVLTDAGRARVVETLPGHVGLVRENLLDLLSPTEIEALRESLERVVTKLRAE
ncbi:MAG: MarR family transcriptional regulator [Microbacteriaceae bacterium]